MVLGILAIAGTNLAFAQNVTPTSTQEFPCAATPFYGAQAYAYIACESLGTAQMYGVAMVVAVVAFSIGCAAVSGNLKH